jgi:1,4-dihydroxy-2-naphthoate octaprenyltransferase
MGTVLAARFGALDGSVFCLTLLFSLFIQIGTNFANDYFDYLKGADTPLRQGPKRATQEGWISPASMKRATAAAFFLAFFVAVPLMIRAGFWSFGVAALCIAFGILYTGGPKPLGYLGLGEVFVFIFFGPVAVWGTYFLQTGSSNAEVLIASLAPALLSSAILIANNLRDEISDRAAGKNTLVVRFGHRFGCWEYGLSLFGALLIPSALIFYFSAPPLILAASVVPFLVFAPKIQEILIKYKDPLKLASLLPLSAALLLLYTALFCFGMMW